MNPSSIVTTILFTLSATVWGSSTDAVAGPGPDQIRSALDVERTLKGFKGGDEGKQGGMIMLTGPVASSGSERNPFMALFRRNRRHHRRHRIHRHPFALVVEERPPSFTTPKAFFEVMKIRERIVVDEQNRPKSAEVALSNDLMQIDPRSGHVKMLRHGELHIKPKHPLIQGGPKPAEEEIPAAKVQNFLVATEFGADGKPVKMPQQGSRLDRFIRFLHLDQFWPLFFFSAICGFTFVGFTFLAAKLILGLIDDNERDSYEPVPNGLLDSIESAQPIKITNQMIEVNESTSLSTGSNDE